MVNEIDLKNSTSAVSNEELKQLLVENQALLKEVSEMTHGIKRYITFQKIMSFVYLVLIIGPIIFSIIYLPPLLKNAFSEYTELLNPSNPSKIFDSVNSGIKK